MNTKKVTKIIDQIQGKIYELKNELGSSGVIKKELPNNKKSIKPKKSKAVDLFQPIKKLYDAKFFIDHKSDMEVKKKLELDLLTEKSPKRASIVNVLRKMVKIGLLTREKVTRNKKAIFCYKNKS